MVPGPPNLNFVVYLEGNKEVIEADTAFGRIARPFFFGNDDEFRNNRFKLIPKIVEGNMMVKMAVKDTPTLIGNKLKQYYFKVLLFYVPIILIILFHRVITILNWILMLLRQVLLSTCDAYLQFL
jgi:hypothetical protein